MVLSNPQRYLISFDSSSLPQLFADVLVIGSGVAGLRAAIELGPKADVILVTKDELKETNTDRAQGGIAAVFGPDDSIQDHIDDTIRVGCGLCDEGVVEQICSRGPELIRELADWGAAFDREGDALALAREGGHGNARVVHARGDGTGTEVERTLIRTVQQRSNVRLIEHTFVIDLLTHDNTCLGAVVWSQARGLTVVWANAVVLAAGGAGQVFRETTNPRIATGDGVAMAYRAGCELRDLEFVQFHPTTLYVAGAARTLISEAARGEGGILVNKLGERFMEKYSEMKELAPRDVVSRAILTEMQQTNDTNVYLDLTHVAPAKLSARFPQIKDLCSLFDINISEDRIPVCPSAHYMIGGVAVAMDGRSSVDRLYACGEAACTGLHGANRLGSNSLLEGLAMGQSTGAVVREAVAGMAPPTPHRIRAPQREPEHGEIDLDDLRTSLRSVMWRNVGIFRDAQGLERTLQRVAFWSGYALPCEFKSPRGWRVQNMLALAELITQCALRREESRGVHFRTDFPETSPKAEHSTVQV
jgi:L-aspartate oxidase